MANIKTLSVSALLAFCTMPAMSQATDTYEKTVSDVGSTIGTAIGKGMMYGVMSAKEWGEDAHCFDVGLGWGVDYGGLGLKVGWRAPLIFGLSAGFGYNTEYDEKHIEDKKMLWNLAMQIWMKNFNIALNLAPRYYKKRNKVETGLGVMFNYVQPVYRFIGVTGGTGLSMSLEGSEENTPTRFEWNLGIVFRFFKD